MTTKTDKLTPPTTNNKLDGILLDLANAMDAMEDGQLLTAMRTLTYVEQALTELRMSREPVMGVVRALHKEKD